MMQSKQGMFKLLAYNSTSLKVVSLIKYQRLNTPVNSTPSIQQNTEIQTPIEDNSDQSPESILATTLPLDDQET